MTLFDKVTIPPQVMARVVGDETIILDLENGLYFGLNPVGARAWQLMAEGQTLGQVCEALLTEYEVTREQLESDILGLAQSLVDRNLVVLAA